MNLKQVTIYMLIFISLVKIANSARESCHISMKTVKTVESCPDNEEEWKTASKRKNCAAYARYCSSPQDLVYHCVINSFINQTVEVCAYKAYIVLGHCTEYNLSGNRIQMNLRTNCSSFANNPCPPFYVSTAAYKYPGCYKLAKKSTFFEDDQTPDNLIDLNIHHQKPIDDKNTTYKVITTLTTFTSIMMFLLVITQYCRRRMRNQSR